MNRRSARCEDDDSDNIAHQKNKKKITILETLGPIYFSSRVLFSS